MDRSSKQKINKETVPLNDTLGQTDLIDIHTTFHPKTAEFAFFSGAHGTYPNIVYKNIKSLCCKPETIKL